MKNPCFSYIVVFAAWLFIYPIFIDAFAPLQTGEFGWQRRVCTLQASLQESDICSKDSETKLKNVPTQENDKHQCESCSKTFASRNALFRHIRSDPSCSKIPGTHSSSVTTRRNIAVEFAYTLLDTHSSSPETEVAGSKIQMAFESSVKKIYDGTKNITIIGSTQTSVANQRHNALSQEPGIASAGDFLIISFELTNIDDSDVQRLDGMELPDDQFNERLSCEMRTLLADQSSINSDEFELKLVECKLLPSDTTLHAEQDCTQRIYHYLLPLSWLPDGDLLQSWWRAVETERKLVENASQADREEENTGLKTVNASSPPSNVLRILRETLRLLESSSIPNRKVRRREIQAKDNEAIATQKANRTSSTKPPYTLSTRRSGAFVNKERRAWHNFANRNLRGDASPNQDPVWRVLDAARIQGFITHPDKDNLTEVVYAVLAFRGDAFVQGQIRGIVGSAVAIVNGWIPSNILNAATRPDIFMPMPAAPKGRLYSVAPRFHYHERKRPFQDILNARGESREGDEGVQWIQQKLLETKLSTEEIDEEQQWLQRLQNIDAPDIRFQLEGIHNGSAVAGKGDNFVASRIPDRAPEVYNEVLQMLRDIVESGEWPETSNARSNVIKSHENGDNTAGRRGSFTVFNPKTEMISKSQSLPQGNVRFPELTEAVFELEKALSANTSHKVSRADIDGKVISDDQYRDIRTPSYCCAINCNAQFTPHVDSGRGAGQSTSMIVGLGDYTGGELFVEGEMHDIRYQPLEFDGWSSRHWTNNYLGERFSLVWFSPQLIE